MIRLTTARLARVGVLLATILVGFGFMVWFLVFRIRELIPQAAIASAPESFAVVPLRLESRPRITRQRGHPHLPFGVSGKNSYRYNGKIRAGDKRLHLTSDQPPIAAVRYEGRYYVLTQGHFDPEDFAWFADDGSGELTRVRASTLPKDAPFIEYEDARLNYLYRTWFLRERLGPVAAESSKLLGRYLAEDPRALYLDDWFQSRGRGAFCLYLRALPGTKQAELFLPHLITILRASQETDDPQTLTFLTGAIVDIAGKEGLNELQSYLQSLDPEDERREVLEEYLKEHSQELLRRWRGRKGARKRRGQGSLICNQ